MSSLGLGASAPPSLQRGPDIYRRTYQGTTPSRRCIAAGTTTGVQTSYIVWMRIGDPARKHGVADADIWHAVRNAMRRVLLDDDLVMLIGPTSDGALLEVGVLDIDGEDPVVIHAQPLRPKFHRFLG